MTKGNTVIPIEFISRYSYMIGMVRPKCEPEPGTSNAHLCWMLCEISNMTDLEKAMRWLGFIQGVLITQGRTTVTAEREFTRPFFKESL